MAKAEQGNDPKTTTTKTPVAKKVQTFEEYLAWAESAKLDENLVVTSLTHPDAEERLHPGTYSSFPTSKGDPSVTWSDGSTQ